MRQVASPAQVRELSSFVWPLRSLADVRRLLALPNAAPSDLVLCEASAVVRDANVRKHRRLTLSVDLRVSAVPGMHACLDALAVAFLDHTWGQVYGFPPCAAHMLSDRRSGEAKCLDGRAFWGILFFIACWCIRCRCSSPRPP